jgi:hypothetical protein
VTGVTSCAAKDRPVDHLLDGLQGHGGLAFDQTQPDQGAIMAKRKRQSKAQKRKAATGRGKARKATKSARAKATKRTVANAKPKTAPVKEAARKVKQPVAPVVETVAADVIEQPVAVTEVEQTHQAS